MSTKHTTGDDIAVDSITLATNTKSIAVNQTEKDDDLKLPDPNAQSGVQEVEALALTWTKPILIAVFAKYVPLLFFLFFYVLFMRVCLTSAVSGCCTW